MTNTRMTAAVATGVALVLAAGVPAIVASTAAAATAPVIASVSRTPSVLVVDSSGHSAYLTIKAHITSAVDVGPVQWALEQHAGAYASESTLTGFMKLTSGTKRDGVWTVSWRATNAVRIGRFARTDVQAVSATGTSPWANAGATYIKVRTKATNSVYPTRVKKGKTYLVSTQLQHITPYVSATGVRFRPFTSTRVTFEFNPDGSGGWRVVKTKSTTASDGRASLKVTAAKSGMWRIRYKGDARNAPCLTATKKVTVI